MRAGGQTGRHRAQAIHTTDIHTSTGTISNEQNEKRMLPAILSKQKKKYELIGGLSESHVDQPTATMTTPLERIVEKFNSIATAVPPS